MRVFVDESQVGGTGGTGPYILVATSVGPEVDLEELRQRLRRFVPGSQRKLHWHEAVRGFRLEILEFVARMDLEHCVVVRDVRHGERPERARRRCLEVLLWEMDRVGTEEVVLESRGPADDRRDLEMLGRLRARRIVGTGIRMFHARGHDEPLVWLPDVICGAVGAESRGNRDYRALIDHQIWSAS